MLNYLYFTKNLTLKMIAIKPRKIWKDPRTIWVFLVRVLVWFCVWGATIMIVGVTDWLPWTCSSGACILEQKHYASTLKKNYWHLYRSVDIIFNYLVERHCVWVLVLFCIQGATILIMVWLIGSSKSIRHFVKNTKKNVKKYEQIVRFKLNYL